MKYVGLQSQINRNTGMSVFLLVMFPLILLGMFWIFLAAIEYLNSSYVDEMGNRISNFNMDVVNISFINYAPYIIIGVAIWFTIAFFFNANMIKAATKAQSLSRKENPRIYNIVENLCMACGMDMPQINIIHDNNLNAFASGINKKTYTVTLTTGIIDYLSDDELAGVIAHELTHIRNKDTHLLITSIVFVGIVSTIMALVMRSLQNVFLFGGMGSSNRKEGKNNGTNIIIVLIIGLVCLAIAYFFTLLTRFAISRKREYMADAGGAELCGKPLALASALRKISSSPGLGDIKREDIAQMYIIKPHALTGGITNMINNMFSTHPDVSKRIAILEQF